VTGSRPSARPALVTLVAVIGLLGACAVLVVLAESPGGSPAAPRSSDRLAASVPSVPVSAAAGLRLMAAAAAACRTVPFRGVQRDSWRGEAGATTSLVQVWHQAGQPVLARYPAGPSGPGERAAGGDLLPDQADVLTITAPLLALMGRNYRITYAGAGTAAGRTAVIVAVRRPDGGLAARYWLDRATGLPLRRELFDRRARIFSQDAFVQLRLGPPGAVPSELARPWAGQLDAARRAALRASGWPLPPATAGGLSLFAATQASSGMGRAGGAIELSYSDGLSVVSVFVQRGELPARMAGWRPVTAGGREVYALGPDGQTLAWSAGGYVVTVIADAPAGTADRAVSGVPAAAPAPGFWARMGRGFGRLFSWVNPLR
jgi:sigma-E factor negative regulatory protein RseB